MSQPRWNALRRAVRRLSFCGVALVALAAPSFAQKPAKPNAPKADPAMQVPFLKIDKFDPALNGEEFSDDAFGFQIRLPKEFKLLDPASLAKLRGVLIPPEDKRTLPSGTVQQMQVYQFTDGKGGSILAVVQDPPLQIGSPGDLRQFLLNQAQGQQTRLDESGKLLQFNGRGNRLGFLCEFDVQVPNQPLTHQYIAFMRAGTRSLLAYYVAPQSTFMAYQLGMQQSIAQIGLHEDKGKFAPIKQEARGFEGSKQSAMLFGNLALLAVVSFVIWRYRSN